MAYHESLGDTLIPAINRLHDIFAQVVHLSRGSNLEDKLKFRGLLIELVCGFGTGFCGGEVRLASDCGDWKPKLWQVKRARGIGWARLPAERA